MWRFKDGRLRRTSLNTQTPLPFNSCGDLTYAGCCRNACYITECPVSDVHIRRVVVVTVEHVVKFSAQLGPIAAFLADAEVFDDAHVLLCRIRAPPPIVEVERCIAKRAR